MDAELVRKLLDYDQSTGVFRWRINASSKAPAGSEAGTKDADGYTVIRFSGRGYKAHRLAFLHTLGRWPLGQVDHRNRVRSDNRWDNLRDATPFQNALNSIPRGGISGVRNVTWFEQYRQWKGSFMHKGCKYFVGHFDSIEAANVAVLTKRAAVGAPTTWEAP